MKRPILHDRSPLHLQLEEALCAAIDAGELPPGRRLPSTQAWAKEWGINPIHLQRALKQLALKGYLDRKPRVGTYIRHQRRVDRVVILCAYPAQEERFHSLRSIFRQMEAELQGRGFEFCLFDSLHTRFAQERTEGIPQTDLATQIRLQRPKVIVEIGFDSLRYVSMQWAYALPKVRLDPPTRGGELFLDLANFFRQALGHTARQAIRNVAIVGRESSATTLDAAHRAAREHGVTITHTLLIEDRDPLAPLDELGETGFAGVLPGWSRAAPHQRAGAIIVVDDILMRGISRALQRQELRPIWQPELVVLSVKGIRHRYAVPVTRITANLEIYARLIVELALARLFQRPGPALPIAVPYEVQP